MLELLTLSFSCRQTRTDNSGKQENMHKYTNELINESSPYLLQHAHNPVNWYPWGEIALNKARDENKILITKCWLRSLSLVPCYGT